MLDINFDDDEEKKRQLLEQLISQRDGDQQPDVVQLPEVKIGSGDTPLPPQYDRSPPEPAAEPPALAARDESSGRMQNEPYIPRGKSDGGDGGFAGMDWGTLGALLLDITSNKGRGVGQLVGAYAANKDADERKKQAHQDRLDELEARKADPSYQLARLQLAQSAQGLRKQGLDQTQDRFAKRESDHSPDSDVYQGDVQKAGDKSAASAKGRITEENALKGLAAETAGARTSATTKAGIETTNENPRALTADEQHDNALADRAAARADEAEALKSDNAKLKAAADMRGSSDKFLKDAGNMVAVARAARSLQKQFAADDAANRTDSFGKRDYHGIGMWDSLKPESARDQGDQDAAAQLDILRSFIQGPITGAAVGGKDESQRINALAGESKGRTEAGAKTAIDQLANLAYDTLRSHASGREGAARAALQPHGLDDLITAPVDDAPASARDALPQTRPDSFVVTPGVSKGRQSSLAPADAGELGPAKAIAIEGAGPMKTVTSPSGNKRRMAVSPEMQNQLEAQGWTVE
jgi:hypothetical protein